MNNQDHVKAVSKVQRYIEDNINNEITLYDLAQISGYSPWHTTRIFKHYVGKSPFEYIRSLRLSKAAMLLREGNKKILDVALDFDFNSHEGFTRAFSKEFGIKPSKYMKQTPPIKLFIPYPVQDYENIINRRRNSMTKKENANTVFVQVIERPKRKLILKRGVKAKDYFEYCNEVGDEVWGILTSIKDALYEPMGLWLPENMIKPGTSTYAQGVEVPHNYEGDIPEGFETIELDECKMMIFQGQPFEDEKFCEAIEELWQVIDNYDPKLYGFEWAKEDAPRFQLEPQGYRGYIEGKPVKLIQK